MPLLTIKWKDGVPQVWYDGKDIQKVTLASAEFEAGTLPTVQIEMSPGEDAIVHLEGGSVHWIVTCPCCGKDSKHSCDIHARKELRVEVPTEVVEVPTSVPGVVGWENA